MNAYQSTLGGYRDAFVAKFSTIGELIWSTYLGGSDYDQGEGIAVTIDGSCYVTGWTFSNDFPIKDAYDSTLSGSSDVFVVKFFSNGNLQWSTYLGGINEDDGYGIAAASDGSCYVIGLTLSFFFPTLNAYQNTNGGFGDVFISKFSSNGELLWSTFIGGSRYDFGYGIAIISNGSCYVRGTTESVDFPIKNAYQNTKDGSNDVFIMKIIEVEDLTGLSIQTIQMLPVNPTQIDEVSIQCSVTDDISGVHFVTLHYHVNGGSWTHENMTNIIDTIYETDIGPFNEDDEISYYITAVDLSGNSVTDDNMGYFYHFTILLADVISPVIVDIAHTPANPTINDTLTITCRVTDVSGIHSVTLYYRLNGGLWETMPMMLIAPNTYRAVLIWTLEIDDLVEYYIKAIDNSPYYNVAIEDNDGQYYAIIIQTPSTTSTTEETALYGFLVFMLIMPIITMLVQKRRK